jgi:pilus assembly protein CpaB
VNNRRAMLIAFVLGLISILLLLLYTRRFEREMSGGEPVRLLMTLKPLKRGTLITDDLLGYRDVPVAYVEERAIKSVERSKVVGVRAATAVPAQGLLQWTDLAVATEDRDLSSLVQPGRRAMTVHASGEDRKSNALIRPGDYVDVLATMTDEGNSSATGEKSVVLLQKVLVLALGLDTEPQAANASQNAKHQGQRDMALTLSLTLQETQLLTLASDKGRLTVALRNPEDQRVSEGIPDMQAGAIFDTTTREKIQTARRTVSAAAAPAAPPPPDGPIKIESMRKR